MDKKNIGIGVLSLLCLVFLSSTVLMSLAYSNADEERNSLESNIADLNNTLDEKNNQISSLESRVSNLEQNNTALNSEINNLEKENRKPRVFADGFTWAMDGDSVVANLNVYNFGQTTAEDVALTFATFEDEDSDEIKETRILSAGNLAGASGSNMDFEFNPEFDVGSDDTAAVWVTECSNECQALSEEVSLIGKSAYE